MLERQTLNLLILDDSKGFAQTLKRLLLREHYEVTIRHTVREVLEYLSISPAPMFILADRLLEGNYIENSDLERLANAAPRSHVIVYTQKADLTSEQIRVIMGQGAKRVLDRADVKKLVDDVQFLTAELEELIELSDELQTLMDERQKLVTALVGANVGVTLIDNEHYCWFASPAQERLVGGPSSGGLCWELFHGHAATAGPCWGCTVSKVHGTRAAAQRLFLSRWRNESVRWVSVQSTPVFRESRGDVQRGSPALPEVMAVREGVLPAGQAMISNLGLQKRLEYIAQGLVHAGFGRARIWAVRTDGGAVVKAAASVTDDPWSGLSEYQDRLGGFAVEPDEFNYIRRAQDRPGGCLVPDWDNGKCPWADKLALELPYFLVPVRKAQEQALWGFLEVDFAGIPETVRGDVLERYARPDTLRWLHGDYAREIREAYEAEQPQDVDSARSGIIERLQLGIGVARRFEDGLTAVRDALAAILPEGCTISLRRLTNSGLEEYDKLSWGPDSPSQRPRIALDDRQSLAAHAVRAQQAQWIPCQQEYCEQAGRLGKPAGYVSDDAESSAHIPLRLEGHVIGSLSIDSRVPIDWVDGGYARPLLRLAYLATLVVRDVTLTEEAEQRKEDMQADLEALKEFAGAVGSDAIWRHWATNRLAEASALVERTRKAAVISRGDLQTIDDGLNRISDAISLVSQGGPPQAVATSCSLEEVTDGLRSRYRGRGAQLVFHIPAHLPLIAAPPFHLRHILEILLTNSLEAIDVSGTGTQVRLEAATHDELVEIRVADDGPGIPPSLARDLLRKPVSSRKGRGVGLLIARGIALRFDGDVRYSPVEHGACFVLTLPTVTETGGEGDR